MIENQLSKYNIILASKSPRRQDLLKKLGLNFKVISRDVDESYPHDMPAESVPAFLAGQKADAYIKDLTNNDLLITADTIVICENEIIGKPESREDAFLMLKKLSGTGHKVITGVCLTTIEKNVCFSAETDVFFDQLSDMEINYYIDNYKPFDKAGAYGIQEWIGFIGVEKINGSFYNVVGLPIHKLYIELKKFIGNH